MRIPKIGERPYKPWPTFQAAHNSEASGIVILGAPRVGKSLATAAEAVAWAPHSQLIWLAGESYGHCREDFEYIMQGLLSLGWTRPEMCSFPLNAYQPCSLDCVFPCEIQTKSLGDLAKQMAGKGPDLLICCEPGLLKESPLERFWERLVTRRGRLWMAGTLEEASEWLKQTWVRWRKRDNSERGAAFSVPMWENLVTFPGGRRDREIRFMERHLRKSSFMERVRGIPAPPENLVFAMVFDNSPARPSHARTKTWHYNRNRPVYLAVDPGYHPSWAWCGAIQHVGPHEEFIWVVDEVTGPNMTQSELIQAVMAQPWWGNVVPGEAGTIDPFAGTSHIYGAASPQEVWAREAGVHLSATIRPSVADTIQRHKFFLRHPATGQTQLFYDAQRCKRLGWEYGRWRYKKDTEGKPIQSEPLKRHCDALKGLGYYLVQHYSRHAFPGVPGRDYRARVADMVAV